MSKFFWFGWVLSRSAAAVCHVKISGKEHIPKKGPFILASNHISNFDPPIMGSCSGRELHFLAKKQLFDNLLAKWWLLGVNSIPLNRGAIDRTALAKCLDALKKGNGLVIFPEGTRSKTGDFLSPKPGIGMLAIQAKCPIVPAFVQGTDRLSSCFLGRSKLLVSFGEPIPAEWLESIPPEKENFHMVASTVMERIKALKEKTLSLK